MTEERYLARMGYAPDSPVGKLLYKMKQAPNERACRDLLRTFNQTALPRNLTGEEARALQHTEDYLFRKATGNE